ncbi:hypothetical protein Pan44_26060 [Caulifigura coniformis]|uniref:Nickel uptake substrate-specific transmembrane region n=1 Tax=Caulifigura coniformis TaxID=2527983 RepID=A0A517SEL6_9PLAN|nr:carboxypeptidase-like regulatory domain-containing protein [Caulifigura coniformis]QDT54573.1 hypothetical protein Pan44_26060 [Caulifigura coniformis]
MERGLSTRCIALAVMFLVLCGPGHCTAWGQGRGRETIAWARGTVRDEVGAPIAGAKVYARATFHGGIRMVGLVRTTTSNEEGEYVIHGPGGLSRFSASLVAYVPGRPPALSWFHFPDTYHSDPLFDPPPPLPRWADVDLVVPSRGGAIEVRVLKDGKPLPKASVALRLEGADPSDLWGQDAESEELKALYDICRPNGHTGEDGTVRFEGVSPGLYSILAIEGGWRRGLGWANQFQQWFFTSGTLKDPWQHIAVHAGETSSHQLSVFSRFGMATFDVRRDGKPWMDLEAITMTGVLPSGDHAAVGSKIGGENSDVYRLPPGVMPISFIKATRTTRYPRTFPFYSADGVIAVSPRLPNSFPIRFEALENHGGMVRVRIEDAGGGPLTGTAKFYGRRKGGLGCDSGVRDISVDGTLIQDFEPTDGIVQGDGQGVFRLVLGEKLERMPVPEELVGRTAILPQPFTAENNRLGEVTLREERVGFLRGRIKPPMGQKVSDYRVRIRPEEYQKGAGVYYEPTTGEFVAGPYRAGSTLLNISKERSLNPLLFKKVDLRAGEVTDVEISINDDAEQMAPDRRLLDARVFLEDGLTPARLARLGYYSPGEKATRGICMTDTGGTPRSKSWQDYDDKDVTEPPGTPQDEVAVAWIPGRNGAAIVPFPERLDEPLVIKLPPPIAVCGKVIVEGEGETVTNGTLTVRAQFEGLGRLDDWLSVETTAGADGAFELAGLTPGRYRVQAALDGIWLSPSVELTASDQTSESIRLTIPRPGGPVLVKVSGPKKESPAQLVVDRPTGPLRDRLWPRVLTADGAGVVRIPALEAGRHRIRVGDVERVVEVPPLEGAKGEPVEVELGVE